VVGAGGGGQVRRQHRAELVVMVVEGGVVGQQVPACPQAKWLRISKSFVNFLAKKCIRNYADLSLS
jgi:hypothetical protein